MLGSSLLQHYLNYLFVSIVTKDVSFIISNFSFLDFGGFVF